MTHAEFENLLGRKIDADVYHSVVEPAYMASSYSDKENFVISWDTTEHIGIITDLTHQVEGYAKSYRALADQRSEMGYFLAEQAEVGSSSMLRAKAIEILGERDYITWKIRNGYNLWESDRKLLLSILD